MTARTSTHTAGFTLVELVIVIVIMGILAAVAAPRFADRAAFDERAYYDDTLAALRYAQKLAVGTGCEVQVSLSASSYTLKQHQTTCTTGAFTRDVFNPGNPGTAYSRSAPAGLTLSTAPAVAAIVFDGQGRASSGTTLTLTGAADTRSINVVAATGLVH